MKIYTCCVCGAKGLEEDMSFINYTGDCYCFHCFGEPVCSPEMEGALIRAEKEDLDYRRFLRDFNNGESGVFCETF